MLRELVRWRPSDGEYAAGVRRRRRRRNDARDGGRVAARAPGTAPADGPDRTADGVDGHGTAGGDGIGRTRMGTNRGVRALAPGMAPG